VEFECLCVALAPCGAKAKTHKEPNAAATPPNSSFGITTRQVSPVSGRARKQFSFALIASLFYRTTIPLVIHQFLHGLQ
jgi:hypothetical protein